MADNPQYSDSDDDEHFTYSTATPDFYLASASGSAPDALTALREQGFSGDLAVACYLTEPDSDTAEVFPICSAAPVIRFHGEDGAFKMRNRALLLALDRAGTKIQQSDEPITVSTFDSLLDTYSNIQGNNSLVLNTVGDLLLWPSKTQQDMKHASVHPAASDTMLSALEGLLVTAVCQCPSFRGGAAVQDHRSDVAGDKEASVCRIFAKYAQYRKARDAENSTTDHTVSSALYEEFADIYEEEFGLRTDTHMRKGSTSWSELLPQPTDAAEWVRESWNRLRADATEAMRNPGRWTQFD